MSHALRSLLLGALLLAGCRASLEQAPSTSSAHAEAAEPPATQAPVRLGAAIPASAPVVALADIAKSAADYKGKSFTTTGTVTGVCQEMGCWMEIRDSTGEAHIRMAGHGFFVPRSASGRKARVQATLIEVPADAAPSACDEEAGKQMGHPVAKLQLEATGVELD